MIAEYYDKIIQGKSAVTVEDIDIRSNNLIRDVFRSKEYLTYG